MIEIKGLHKHFGETKALQAVDLHVPEGEIFGLIGPNGAGKTTTIRILTTVEHPTAGEAFIDGVDVVREPEKVRPIIGHMPEMFGLYDDMTVWEYLDFFARVYRLSSSARAGIVDDVIELTDLGQKREAMTETLSRGVRQRLYFAKTLLHDPKVLLLDEPAAGLDPRARIEFWEMLRELRRQKKTIFISSHILADLTDLCTMVAVIEEGKVLIQGPVEDIARSLRGGLRISLRVLDEDAQKTRELLARSPHVSAITRRHAEWEFRFDGAKEDVPQLHKRLVDNGIKVYSFDVDESGLEDIFMRITKGVIS